MLASTRRSATTETELARPTPGLPVICIVLTSRKSLSSDETMRAVFASTCGPSRTLPYSRLLVGPGPDPMAWASIDVLLKSIQLRRQIQGSPAFVRSCGSMRVSSAVVSAKLWPVAGLLLRMMSPAVT